MRCRKCPTEIAMVKTAKGKFMPVDLKPNPEGNVIILEGTAHVLAPDTIAALSAEQRGLLRMSHFGTCPFARDFSRKTKKEKGVEHAENHD